MTTNVTVTGTTATVTDDGTTVVVTAASTSTPAWGAITGTLANQTDLTAALAGKAPSACLWISGTAGNNVSCPDAAALDITGDLDIRIKVALDDWTPADYPTLVAKHGGSGQISWQTYWAPGGTPNLEWTADGTTVKGAYFSAPSLTDGVATWLRFTLDVDNGASGWTAKAYTSTDGTTWTQIGSDQTGAGVTSIFASTATVCLGSRSDTGGPATGKFYRAQILNGIAGTTVADWRGDIPATRYRDPYSNLWTVGGSANAWMVA